MQLQTGNSTTTSVIGHNHQQLAIGAPSMDWFTKEVQRVKNGKSPQDVGDDEEAAVAAIDIAKVKPDEDNNDDDENSLTKSEDGRRLRKRQQKRNYKDIQRVSLTNSVTVTTNSNSSWSCASSTSSSTTSSWTGAAQSLMVSPFSTTAASNSSAPMFTLEELRWAFLPKSHKSFRRRRSGKGGSAGGAVKSESKKQKSIKVPYDKVESSSGSSRSSSRRASRDVADTYTSTSKVDLEAGSGINGGGKGIKEGADFVARMKTKERIERGDKYIVRGKRRDKKGIVQYLIEWEDVEDEHEDE